MAAHFHELRARGGRRSRKRVAVTLDLTVAERAGAVAGDTVRDLLSAWSVDDPVLLSNALLLANELVGDAVRRGAASARLEVGRDGYSLALAISSGAARVRSPRWLDSEASGLSAVDARSSRWGIERSASGGQRVWAHLDI